MKISQVTEQHPGPSNLNFSVGLMSDVFGSQFDIRGNLAEAELQYSLTTLVVRFSHKN